MLKIGIPYDITYLDFLVCLFVLLPRLLFVCCNQATCSGQCAVPAGRASATTHQETLSCAPMRLPPGQRAQFEELRFRTGSEGGMS